MAGLRWGPLMAALATLLGGCPEADDSPLPEDDDGASDDDAADDDGVEDDDAADDDVADDDIADDDTGDDDTADDDTADDDTGDDDTGDDDTADDDTSPGWALAPWLGLDINAPIDAATGDTGMQVNPVLIAASGAGWARVNFILGPWVSPEDGTPHGALGFGWEDTYRVIVDSLVAQGLEVYGLIGGEAVDSPHAVGSDEWLEEYVYNFVAIVDRFKDSVRTFESFNEPNNWGEDSEPVLDPSQFALLLQEVYLEVKHHNGHLGDPDWQVTLVSGPLFSHDADTAADYLDETYAYGRGSLAWDWTYSETGSYPLDGLGYHLYVAQGATSSGVIEAAMDGNLSAVWEVLEAWEGVGTTKGIWVSEVGWSSDHVGEEGQADALEAALMALRGDSRVDLATWFCLVDFPGAAYGLRSDAATPKAAWDRFRSVADAP